MIRRRLHEQVQRIRQQKCQACSFGASGAVKAKASNEELEIMYNLTAVATKALPVEDAKVVCENVELVLCKAKDNKRQIWLHSKANKEYTLQNWILSWEKVIMVSFSR